MKHIDLFSGIGGFALAASWVWRDEYMNVGHSEIAPYPCRVYHRHFPGSKCLGDVSAIEWEKHEGIDLLTGGFPCQPHSSAGKRKASADSRDLWSECARATRILRPRWAVFENVPGLLVSERGAFFNRVLADLALIGYDAEWYSISAEQVGAPHRRKRVWIVAYPNSMREQQSGGNLEEGRRRTGNGGQAQYLPDANGTRLEGQPRNGDNRREPRRDNPHPSGPSSTSGLGDGKAEVCNAAGVDWWRGHTSKGQGAKWWRRPCDTAWWAVEPKLGRLANGVPNRVDRYKALGNAIVPQVAYLILSAIKQQEEV